MGGYFSLKLGVLSTLLKHSPDATPSPQLPETPHSSERILELYVYISVPGQLDRNFQVTLISGNWVLCMGMVQTWHTADT
jgi:hypothetical protein